jgi:N-acetylglucosamine-6-phosphate deacetylase
MAEGLRRLITVVGTSPEIALDMASAAPARLLGRPDLGSPEHRDLADLLLLAPDWTVSTTLADLLQTQPA